MFQISTCFSSHLIFLLIIAFYWTPRAAVVCSIVPAEICRNYAGDNITCPENSDYDKGIMETFMDECPPPNSGSDLGCFFFPEVQNKMTGKLESCHLHTKSVDCMRGFTLKATRENRRSKGELIFISVKFFGKVQPLPMKKEEALALNRPCDEDIESCFTDDFDTAEYVAFALSLDRKMGDDAVIYCHPYMDPRIKYANESDDAADNKYPDEIGISINKYFTPTSGQQAYDAEWIFNTERGEVKPGKVTYHDGNDERMSYAVLECEFNISTYILLQSKSEISTGIELDMEQDEKLYGMIAVGSCLDRRCLGTTARPPFGDIAKRYSVIARHRKAYTTGDLVSLYRGIHKGGAVPLSDNKMSGFMAFALTFIVTCNLASLC